MLLKFKKYKSRTVITKKELDLFLLDNYSNNSVVTVSFINNEIKTKKEVIKHLTKTQCLEYTKKLFESKIIDKKEYLCLILYFESMSEKIKTFSFDHSAIVQEMADEIQKDIDEKMIEALILMATTGKK